ncbi:HAD family hydrolase [Pseudonocardia humida]|uniref:HAD hydrolase-like protein n=1 Tax=Pseudonocardia humida TaxID=2800819 RepID=A0ABT1A4C4_9PSEU|nr:HAD family hydrolase [Pseudonocardia humida]MCO1657851.1 HAD hydrolase-like protein [Pseudonocardia humida]
MLIPPVRAVLVDLDDTLHPQAEFLDTAWRAVAQHGARRGLNPDALLGALREETAAGSARGSIIDRALARAGADPSHVEALLAAFRAVEPPTLTPYPGALRALAALRRRVPVGLVADGEVTGQRRKLAALGLTDAFDVVVLGDLDGRDRRKPHPAPFRRALAGLGVPPERVVMIGDRPDEDVAGAVAAGLRAVRVRTGEYATRPDHPGTWFSAPCLALAVHRLLPHLPDPPDPDRSEQPPGCGPPTAPSPACDLPVLVAGRAAGPVVERRGRQQEDHQQGQAHRQHRPGRHRQEHHPDEPQDDHAQADDNCDHGPHGDHLARIRVRSMVWARSQPGNHPVGGTCSADGFGRGRAGTAGTPGSPPHRGPSRLPPADAYRHTAAAVARLRLSARP